MILEAEMLLVGAALILVIRELIRMKTEKALSEKLVGLLTEMYENEMIHSRKLKELLGESG